MASEASVTGGSNPAPGTWGGWFAAAQNQALDIAGKAQKIAQEQASVVASKAEELRKRYELEKASSIFMSVVGNPMDSADIDTNGELRTKMSELDIVYITENMISMAFPYDPKKPTSASKNGNDINAVAAFLKKRHPNHFMIWNISEEAYDYSKFSDQVLEYNFPGHPSPPLGLLFKICTSVESWLDADEKNIAICHCLTGKGRTAALTACILTWMGEFTSPMEALQYIAERRSISVDHLTIPSQRRYIQYFSNILDGVKPRAEPLMLRRVIMNSIPVFGTNGDDEATQGCCPYIQLFKNGKLIATAAPFDDAETSSGGLNQRKQLQLRWTTALEGSVSFTLDCAVQGDILLRCRHAAVSGARISMFRAGFHTGYVPSGVLRLTKAQLDGASSDSRFDEDFFIDLIFAPVTKSAPASGSGVDIVNVATNSAIIGSSEDSKAAGSAAGSSSSSAVVTSAEAGMLSEAVSTDKFEMTLHKDGRFWETISDRKQKIKRRRMRKFLSAQQEQFTLGDDDDMPAETKFMPSGVEVGALSSSGLSDMDLIMQLANAETGDVDTPPAAASGGASGGGAGGEGGGSGVGELQALEDLEKELGLGDLQLFTTGSAKSSSTRAAAAGDDASSSALPTGSITAAGGAAAAAPMDASDASAGVDVDIDMGVDLDLDGMTLIDAVDLTAEGALAENADAANKNSDSAAAIAAAAEDEENLDELEQYLQSLSAGK